MALELWWDGLIWMVVIFHLLLTPYTKVEESFNLQACHDALLCDLATWDHLQFPGAVPRSFLGALVTSIFLMPFTTCSPAALLRLVRLVLASFSVLSTARLRAAITREWGTSAARCFALILLAQFHLPFYMSRSLPNVFALQLANLAHAELMTPSIAAAYRCLMLLALAAAIFRCDLLLLIAPVGLTLLWQRRVSFWKAAAVTAAAAALGAILSILVDSMLWRRWLWPEFEVLWFNTAENQSSNWGTQPLLWYFYSALPRGLLGALPLALLAVFIEPRARMLVLVAVSFTCLYSFLPHKELRFIFPVLPLMNAAAAGACARLLRQKWLLAHLALSGIFTASVLVTCLMTCASFFNYPGGIAMAGLHDLEPNTKLSVHIGNLAAISGVSRFSQERTDWVYSKEEGLDAEALAARSFDRLVSEYAEVPGYECMAQVKGFRRLSSRGVELETQIYVLRKSIHGTTGSCQGTPMWSAWSQPEFQTFRLW